MRKVSKRAEELAKGAPVAAVVVAALVEFLGPVSPCARLCCSKTC